MWNYQIMTVSANLENEGKGGMGIMVDSLEKIVQVEVEKGWEPQGGVAWSPLSPVGRASSGEVHVSQVLKKFKAVDDKTPKFKPSGKKKAEFKVVE